MTEVVAYESSAGGGSCGAGKFDGVLYPVLSSLPKFVPLTTVAGGTGGAGMPGEPPTF